MDEKAKENLALTRKDDLESWDGTLWLEPITVKRILEMPEADDKEALDELRRQAQLQISKGE